MLECLRVKRRPCWYLVGPGIVRDILFDPIHFLIRSLDVHKLSLPAVQRDLDYNDLAVAWIQAIANMVTGNEDVQSVILPWILGQDMSILP